MEQKLLPEILQSNSTENLIYHVRDMYVMLDSDIAFFFQVETSRLNEQMKRNKERFPKDFCVKLNSLEFKNLRSQNAIFREATKGRKYAPYMYTEHGIIALAGVLKSDVAAKASVEICRKFIQMRKMLLSNHQLLAEVGCIREDLIEFKNETNKAIEDIYRKIERYDLPKNQIVAEGRVYDAFEYIVKIIKSASRSIVLVDPYTDASAFIYLNHKNNDVHLTIYKGTQSRLKDEEIQLFEAQNGKINVSTKKLIHGRYIIIDQKECYLLDGSLNRTAKSLFAIIALSLESAKRQIITEYPL